VIVEFGFSKKMFVFVVWFTVEEEAMNEIENLWNRRRQLAESLEIPIKATNLSYAELIVLSKRMIEWFQTRKELKENPEGLNNSFSEGNIYKA
jgi:hypothetical protein